MEYHAVVILAPRTLMCSTCNYPPELTQFQSRKHPTLIELPNIWDFVCISQLFRTVTLLLEGCDFCRYLRCATLGSERPPLLQWLGAERGHFFCYRFLGCGPCSAVFLHTFSYFLSNVSLSILAGSFLNPAPTVL